MLLMKGDISIWGLPCDSLKVVLCASGQYRIYRFLSRILAVAEFIEILSLSLVVFL